MQAVARNPWLNKQNPTNGIALALVIFGLALPHEDGNPWLSMGSFFCGAVTNWLAIYALQSAWALWFRSYPRAI